MKPIYYDRIKAGVLNPVTHFEIVRETPTTAVVDGHNGMGHVIAKRAMQMAIDKARRMGLAMIAVRHSTHFGIAGYYAGMATDAGMIGITGTNARPSIAPTFGVENMLGTNPLTFGIPSDEPFPFLIDCATSVTQRGKIELYERLGQELPPGLVLDRKGGSCTDAGRALDDLAHDRAALAPLGGAGEATAGYKGYGYATVVEILSSALQAGNFMKALSGIRTANRRRSNWAISSLPSTLPHSAIRRRSRTRPAMFYARYARPQRRRARLESIRPVKKSIWRGSSGAQPASRSRRPFRPIWQSCGTSRVCAAATSRSSHDRKPGRFPCA